MYKPRVIFKRINPAIRYVLMGIAILSWMPMGCMPSNPDLVVQEYLRMFSGELEATDSALERITTQHYRETHHEYLESYTGEAKEKYIDLAVQFSRDPVLRQFGELITWTTSYETIDETETSMSMVARVIMGERRPGDREKALEIPGLPDTIAESLRNGLELPFHFDLVKENGKWKIDDLILPDAFLPLVTFGEE